MTLAKFKIGDKVKVKCCRSADDFPKTSIYNATITNVKYDGITSANACWQYRVKYNDNQYSFGWLLEQSIKFCDEQFDVEVL